MSFIIEPKIRLLHGGEYKSLEPVVYYSRKLGVAFNIPAGFVFSPSIPTIARVLVPVTSDIVAASLPHDFLYQTADRGVTQKQADIVGREELERRGVNKHIVLRFYYALRVFGHIAWDKNRNTEIKQGDTVAIGSLTTRHKLVFHKEIDSNEELNITIKDCRGEFCDSKMWINKGEAKDIINHLASVFGITESESVSEGGLLNAFQLIKQKDRIESNLRGV